MKNIFPLIASVITLTASSSAASEAVVFDHASYPIHFLLTHPRSTGTAFEQIMRTHGDMTVLHQPFLDSFLLKWLPIGEPYLKNISPGLTDKDVGNKLFQLAEKQPVFLKEQGFIVLDYFKAYPDFYRNPQVKFAFLIRDPAKSIISCYYKMPSIDNMGIGLIGHEQLWELFNMIKDATGKTPIVIDSDELLKNPLAILNQLGDSWGMTFTEKDLHWKKGYADEWLHIDSNWYVEVSDSTQLEPYRGDIPREADGTPAYAEVEDLQARKRLQNMYHSQIGFYHKLLQYAIQPKMKKIQPHQPSAHQSLKDILSIRITELIEQSQQMPGLTQAEFSSIKDTVSDAWKVLAREGILEVTCTDQEARSSFVALQGIIEHVLSTELRQHITTLDGFIHTPMPATPLCTRGEISRELVDSSIEMDPHRLLTIKARATIVRDYLFQGGNLYIVYPRSGLLKRTLEQQQIYKEELRNYPSHLFDVPLNIDSIPLNWIGATYFFKDQSDNLFVFGIKMTQANHPQDIGHFGLWFGSIDQLTCSP